MLTKNAQLKSVATRSFSSQVCVAYSLSVIIYGYISYFVFVAFVSILQLIKKDNVGELLGTAHNNVGKYQISFDV